MPGTPTTAHVSATFPIDRNSGLDQLKMSLFMLKILRFGRSFFLLVLSIGFFLAGGGNTLWIPLACFAIWFFAKDVLKVKSGLTSTTMEKGGWEVSRAFDGNVGVLGEYEIDSTLSYGLFLVLRGQPVFVDIKKDKLLEERKKQALHLVEKSEVLDGELLLFVTEHPEFLTRRVVYIGLHSKEAGRAEVFWEPDGYTLLRGTTFTLE